MAHQARLAEIATIVDEERQRRCAWSKSFAAEERQLSMLERAARRVQWAYVRDADIRGRWRR